MQHNQDSLKIKQRNLKAPFRATLTGGLHAGRANFPHRNSRAFALNGATFLSELKDIPTRSWIILAAVVAATIGMFILVALMDDAQRFREADRKAGYSLPEWTVFAALKRILTGKKL